MNIVVPNRKIHTASNFAKNNLLFLQEAGTSQTLIPHDSNHKHLKSFLFFIVTDGCGTLMYNDQEYFLRANSCVFIDCEQSYTHCSSEDALWTLKWVHFYGSNMNEIYRKYIERGGIAAFTPYNISGFTKLLDELYILAQSEDYIKDMRINEKISSLLTLIMEESWHPENKGRTGTKKQSLQYVKNYIDQNYKNHITLDLLSEKFYINKFYLTRAFKNQFGITINAYLMQTRIARAKELLRFSSMTLEQIGSEVGIAEPGYFNSVFKKVEGITPGAYRKQW